MTVLFFEWVAFAVAFTAGFAVATGAKVCRKMRVIRLWGAG